MTPNQISRKLLSIASAIEASKRPSRRMVLRDLRQVLASIGESHEFTITDAYEFFQNGWDGWKTLNSLVVDAFMKNDHKKLTDIPDTAGAVYFDIEKLNHFANFNAAKKQTRRTDKIGGAKKSAPSAVLECAAKGNKLWGTEVANSLDDLTNGVPGSAEKLAQATLELCECLETIENHVNWVLENPTG